MRRLGLLVLGFTLAAGAFANDSLQRLADVHFEPGVQVPFMQTHISPLLRREVVQQGVMSYADDGLRMVFTQPRWEERVLSGETLTLHREMADRRGPGTRRVSRSTTLDLEQPQHLALYALQAVLRGQTSVLQRHFELQSRTQSQGWHIDLIPLNPEQRQVMPRLGLSGQGQKLTRFRSERVNEAGEVTHFVQVDIEPPEPEESQPTTSTDAPPETVTTRTHPVEP